MSDVGLVLSDAHPAMNARVATASSRVERMGGSPMAIAVSRYESSARSRKWAPLNRQHPPGPPLYLSMRISIRLAAILTFTSAAVARGQQTTARVRTAADRTLLTALVATEDSRDSV